MIPFRLSLAGLRRTLRPIRFKVLLSIILGLMQVVLSLSFVWVSKNAVDIATGDSSVPLGKGIALFLGVLLAQILVRIFANYWNGYVIVRAQNDTRARVFSRVMRSVWSGKERFHSGDTVNRLEEDIRVVIDFLCNTVPGIVVTVCQFIAATVFLFSMSPELGWILVFIMPVAVLGSRLFFRKMRKLTGEIRQGDSAVQAHMQENLQHRMVVRTMGSTGEVIDDLDDLQADVQHKTITRLNYNAAARLIMQLGFTCGYAAAFIWSVKGISDGSVTYGMMTAFLQLVNQVQRPVAEITRQIPAFIRALTSEERLLELDSLEQVEEGEEIHLPGAPGVRLRNLGFRYEGQEEAVFEHLDYVFAPGTTTAVIGSTGVGKSTLVKVIMSLLKPFEGEVELYDPATPVSAATLCNFMYVPQGNSLMSGTIRQNLLLAAPDASDDKLLEVLHLAAADFVKDLPAGLDTECAEVGAGLSEGQAQRIAIARALLRPGGILILDEATSALDADTELELLGNLSGKYRGSKTIICITHREAATGYADAVLDMSQGRRS